MLNKETLREEFSKEPKKYYTVKTFEEEGFVRKQCKECSKYFWTADSSRELCGDSSHESYSFFKDHPTDVGYAQFWRKFAKFFKAEGHEEVERYPVVSRWRPDLYFTIASIQDFQRLENGHISFEYKTNPLVVPQICMRFNDIANVGVTGRHFSAFTMAGQHAFNYPDEGYWRDRTIELNYKFLTTILGVKKEDLTYIEDVWAMGDFSEFGPSLESFANGLEISNNVFTQFEYANDTVHELKGKVVDVGWGFERLMWFDSGEQTAYDAVFKKQLNYLHKNTGFKPDPKTYMKIAGKLGTMDATESSDVAKTERAMLKSAGVSEDDYYTIIKPMQAVYAICDYTRSLLFAISDGALPSNVGGGYNLRIILRRAFDFMDQYHLKFDIMKLMELHLAELRGVYKNMDSNVDSLGEILDIERKRYENNKRTATKLVSSIIARKEKLTKERLVTLYESNGITPDMINAAAEASKVKIEIPSESYLSLIKGDFVSKHKSTKSVGFDVTELKKTTRMYYESDSMEADAKVLAVHGNVVILDRTPFYAEGGGQEADHGTIDEVPVIDVQNNKGVILHTLGKKREFKLGQKVHCVVNMDRRLHLMAHHTATHLISAASRSVLGKHAWQEGAKKSYDKAHIDVAHYERLTEAQVQAIEDKANSYITHGIKVSAAEFGREEAETQFGFSIYQGHGVPSKRLRIIQIRDLDGNLIDAEACGGLHLVGKESIIGMIKIISTSKIHDGINRIEFVAGPAAVERINSMERDIENLAKIAGTDKDKVSTGLAAKLEELKQYKKKYEDYAAMIAALKAKEISAKDKQQKVQLKLDFDRIMLRAIATQFAEQNPKRAIALYNDTLELVSIAGLDSGISAMDYVHELETKLGKSFKGGGSKRIAEGRFS